MQRRLTLVTVILLVFVIGFGCLDTSTSPSSSRQAYVAATPVQQPPPAHLPNNTINWSNASPYIGEYGTVCGPVVDSHYASSSSGRPTFLNMGKTYPDAGRFTVVIWGRNRSEFPSNPEQYYRGRNICVSGLIEEYKGVCEIEADNPDQVKVVD